MIPGIPFKLNAAEGGAIPNFQDALMKAYESMAAQYKPQQAAEELLKQKLSNAITRPYAENAEQVFRTDLGGKQANTGLLGAQAKLAQFFANNPLLKLPGAAGQIGTMMYLDQLEKNKGGQQGAGWHDTGHGAGYDNGPMVPNPQSAYGESESTINPSSGRTGGAAPDLNSVIDSLPPEKRDAIKKTLSESGTPLEMILNKQVKPVSYAEKLRDAYNADLEKTKTLNEYRKSLTETAGKRASTSLSKTAQELEDVNAGFMPGTNRQVSISPEMQSELSGQYRLQMQKQVSDTQTRSKNLMASNIEKTLDNINPKSITQFAGLYGAVNKKLEEGKALTGNESKAYDEYVNAVDASKLLAKQVRQFYGDSIQPSVAESLARLSNPATWRNNPKLAEQEFNTFKRILNQEMGTYRGALKNTKEYEGGSKKGSSTKLSDPLGIR